MKGLRMEDKSVLTIQHNPNHMLYYISEGYEQWKRTSEVLVPNMVHGHNPTHLSMN